MSRQVYNIKLVDSNGNLIIRCKSDGNILLTSDVRLIEIDFDNKIVIIYTLHSKYYSTDLMDFELIEKLCEDLDLLSKYPIGIISSTIQMIRD